MVSLMTTDHYAMATSLMVTANILKDAIDDQFAIRRKTPEVLIEITRLKADHKNTMEMARLHVGMADVQATHDLRSVVEQLAKDLNDAEPFQLVDGSGVIAYLRPVEDPS